MIELNEAFIYFYRIFSFIKFNTLKYRSHHFGLYSTLVALWTNANLICTKYETGNAELKWMEKRVQVVTSNRKKTMRSLNAIPIHWHDSMRSFVRHMTKTMAIKNVSFLKVSEFRLTIQHTSDPFFTIPPPFFLRAFGSAFEQPILH